MIRCFSPSNFKLGRKARCLSNPFSRRIIIIRRPSIVAAAATVAALGLPIQITLAAFSTTTTSNNRKAMPAGPYAFLMNGAVLTIDLSKLSAEINETEDKRQEAYDASRKLQAAMVRAKAALDSESSDSNQQQRQDQQALEQLVLDTVGATADRSPREANLSARVEDYVRFKAFLQFLEAGSLLAPSATPYATDEEYLAGACMGLAQDLARYGLGRATARDVESVTMAKDLVQEILEYLLQFDFRNGPLRRKYDGTKYALKNLETLLYEISITGATTSTAADDNDGDNDTGEKPAKMLKPSNESNLLAHDELKSLRERMEHRDSLRETLIKRCRDGQKAAKQAIFALHRGDPTKAQNLMEQCEACIQQDLLPIVEEEPQLRYGSFANLMEEYAEAKLFYAWLFRDATTIPPPPPSPSTAKPPPARLLLREDFAPLELEPSEYLGGLCDLTGEVGRYAVQMATLRDGDGVKLCLQTNRSILTALQSMERFPREIGKKMDQLSRSVEKLERILYEMSLSEAAGGRNVKTDSMDIEPDSKGGDMDDL